MTKEALLWEFQQMLKLLDTLSDDALQELHLAGMSPRKLDEMRRSLVVFEREIKRRMVS